MNRLQVLRSPALRTKALRTKALRTKALRTKALRTKALRTKALRTKAPHFQIPLQSRQQRIVILRPRDPLDHPLHRGLRRHLLQPASQRVDGIELVRAIELFLAPGATGSDIEGREDPLLRE